tara:strand:- start:530 stop:757 length:228 start_codon:yes stop_codon:yes gene_type:complete
MNELTIIERQTKHRKLHPNDKGVPKESRGVTWSKRTEKDKKLDEFYATHVYTFVDAEDVSKKRWVRISGFAGEEE